MPAQHDDRAEDRLRSRGDAEYRRHRLAHAGAQEDLGDLKLYRIPEPVTVAANSQKQVAFLERTERPGRASSTASASTVDEDGDLETGDSRVLVTRNRAEEGLGIPLPAGRVQLFADAGGRPILLGEGSLDDRAVGEDVEIAIGEAPGVIGRVEEIEDDGRRLARIIVLTVTNDQAEPVPYEAEFDVDEGEPLRAARPARAPQRAAALGGDVPANGTATLRYRVVEADD